MRSVARRMLTSPALAVSVVLLPFCHEHQSMAASFHGSANIRCVSTPSGGLSSRRAVSLLRRALAAAFVAHHTFIISSAAILLLRSLRLLTTGPVSEVSEEEEEEGGEKKNARTPAPNSSPTAGACHPPPSPPIPYSPSLRMRKCVFFFATLSDTLCCLPAATTRHKSYPHFLGLLPQGGALQDKNPNIWMKTEQKKIHFHFIFVW